MSNETLKFSFQLQGANELRLKLNTLNDKVHSRIARESVRSAMQMYLTQAKGAAVGMVGGRMGRRLAGQLMIRKQRKRLPKFVYAMVCGFRDVGLLIHTSKKQRKTFIPAAIEFGHGRNPAGSAIPYMRRTFERMRAGMISTLSAVLGRRIEEEARK